MAYNPYEERREFDVKEFVSQIEEYKDRHGDECSYVKCEHKNADYSVLDRQQKAYYLYWRDELAKGNCLKADRGYVKLRICEIINSDINPKDGMRQLKLLFDNTRQHGMPQSDIASAMFDYAIVNDMDLPIMWMGKGSVRSFMMTSELMAYPARRIGKELVWYLSGGPKVHADGVDQLKHITLFNDSLGEIDRFLYENTGKGIAKTYSEGMGTDLYKVYLYLPYAKDRDYQITFEKLRTDGVFGEFMLGLFSYTRKVLCKAIGEKGPSTPSSFNKEFRTIVDRVFNEGATEHERIEREWRGTTRIPMSSKERALIDMGASLEAQFGSAEKPKAIMNVDENAEKQHVSPHLKSDIERNWNVTEDGVKDYIPSGFTNPDYRSFNENQRRFYIYWRNRTRKGLYGETDSGYLWLYLCELINIVDDPKTILDQLVGLYRAYGNFDEDKIIGHTCFDYAVAHKLPLPDPTIYESNVTACMVMDHFLNGMDSRPDKNLLLFLSGISDKTVTREFDDDCVGITCEFLKAVQTQMGSEGTSINEYCMPEKTSNSIDLYKGLKYFKESRKARITTYNYIYNAAFNDSLKEIVKTAFNAVRMKRTGKPVKIAKFTAFGIDGKDLMTSAVSKWYSDKEVAEIKEKAESLVLDKEAVSGAEDALNQVTRMMSIENEEIHEQVEIEAPTVSDRGTWDDLSDRLSSEQKGYLKAIIKGNGREYLGSIGSSETRMIDSINNLAMDIIGDAIIENGEIFEEYVESIRSVL